MTIKNIQKAGFVDSLKFEGMTVTGMVALMVKGPPALIPCTTRSDVPLFEMVTGWVCKEPTLTSPKEKAQGSIVMFPTPTSVSVSVSCGALPVLPEKHPVARRKGMTIDAAYLRCNTDLR